jgi:hypothetical protein
VKHQAAWKVKQNEERQMTYALATWVAFAQRSDTLSREVRARVSNHHAVVSQRVIQGPSIVCKPAGLPKTAASFSSFERVHPGANVSQSMERSGPTATTMNR